MTKEEYSKILDGIELIAQNQLKLFKELQEIRELVHGKSHS